jgi:hypothetical protein
MIYNYDFPLEILGSYNRNGLKEHHVHFNFVKIGSIPRPTHQEALSECRLPTTPIFYSFFSLGSHLFVNARCEHRPPATSNKSVKVTRKQEG